MTLHGPRQLWAMLTIATVVGLAASLVSCASIGPTTSVAVSDVKSLAGKWAGVVYAPGYDDGIKIDMTIREDGSYDVASRQRDPSSSGKGKIVLTDGRLIVEGQRGNGVATLQRGPGGLRILSIEMTLSDNSYLSAELSPSR
jgi:hypothetical protein